MALDPITREEHFLARAAGNLDAKVLDPITREEHFLQDLIDAIEESGSSGIPVSFRNKLIRALSACSFSTTNGRELVDALRTNDEEETE